MLLVTFFKILEWLGGFRLILKFIIYTNVIKREEVIVRIRGNLRNCLTDLDDPLTVGKYISIRWTILYNGNIIYYYPHSLGNQAVSINAT